MESVLLTQTVYGKNTYKNVINTTFNQLLPTVVSASGGPDTIENFFRLYGTLFYDIPKTGSLNSHTYLITESTDYVGTSQNSSDIQALLNEINVLRQEIDGKDSIILSLTAQIASSSMTS